MTKPLGTVWTAQARLQRIDGHTWQTLGTCIDTPNAIIAKAQELVDQGQPMNQLWVVGDVTERQMLVDMIKAHARKESGQG